MAAGFIFAAAGVFALKYGFEASYMMQCQKLTQKQLEAARTHFDQLHRYVLSDKGRSSVQFQFNLSPMVVGESLFAIYSNRTLTTVYLGPYQPQLTVEIDDNLTSDKGYDQLEFRLLQLEKMQGCLWANEQDEPYWQPGARIAIEFLRAQVLDENELPKRFDVTIR
ncbi:hypothetical protein JQX13_16460 [Archangium violaceum]|uniref:hypothetical protein n=1 Tax=Archangium violaceum TaxID=83451 RepID=UPI00193C59D9|nr:hypothetical protein [Archangium violaceum]QRK11021.1 hypothetical protein JQX13_13680 [Archangium violaceum]QRK11521.1 hypothetical protein JQX13_16460 [Archangium violaceum]